MLDVSTRRPIALPQKSDGNNEKNQDLFNGVEVITFSLVFVRKLLSTACFKSRLAVAVEMVLKSWR